MNNTFTKLAFLVFVIGAALFSRMVYPSFSPTNLAAANDVVQPNAASSGVPMFIMPSAAVSAGGGAVSGTQSNADAPAVLLPSQAAQPPALQDTASLVADLTSGKLFESVNTGSRWPTASIAKLMTATVVADKLGPKTTITITENMFAADVTEQALVVGGTYTVSDLMKVMLLPSSNVAAEALASFYGRDAFIAEMNARAAAWGMEDSHFDDPSGISAGDESTANDLLKLAQKIYADYPQILQTTRTPQASITEQNSGRKILVKSINNFAGEADFIGGKTGHTDQADGNLLSIFRYAGKPLLVIVLGSNDRFNDTTALYDWYKTNL